MVESRGNTRALDGLDRLTANQLVNEIAFLDEAIKEGKKEYGVYFTGYGVGATLYVRRKAAKARLQEIPNILAELSEPEKPLFPLFTLRNGWDLIYNALALVGLIELYKGIWKACENAIF